MALEAAHPTSDIALHQALRQRFRWLRWAAFQRQAQFRLACCLMIAALGAWLLMTDLAFLGGAGWAAGLAVLLSAAAAAAYAAYDAWLETRSCWLVELDRDLGEPGLALAAAEWIGRRTSGAPAARLVLRRTHGRLLTQSPRDRLDSKTAIVVLSALGLCLGLLPAMVAPILSQATGGNPDLPASPGNGEAANQVPLPGDRPLADQEVATVDQASGAGNAQAAGAGREPALAVDAVSRLQAEAASVDWIDLSRQLGAGSAVGVAQTVPMVQAVPNAAVLTVRPPKPLQHPLATAWSRAAGARP